MKRNIRMATICTAAVLLAAGASMTAYAAGWEQQNGTWIYTDASNNRIRNSWRQSGNNYFYLDGNGVMATDRWIDDTYYVDINGARVSDRWIYAEAGSSNTPNRDGGWFYLDSGGRVVTDGWRTINNQRYHFDYDGTMQYGWLEEDDNLYYLGDENDGAMKTGWLALDYDEEDRPDNGDVSAIVSSGTMGEWFYFQQNGRAVKANGSDSYVNRTINGYRYYFDEYGVMVTGWAAVAEREAGDRTGISTLKYFGGPDEGQMARGWRYLMDDPEDADIDFYFNRASSSNAQRWDGDDKWYYFDSSGVPSYLNEGADSLSDATTRINGQNYFFDEYGRMQSGLLGFYMSDGSVLSAYFGRDDSDGSMKRERQTNVVDDDGERDTYYFQGSGTNRGGGYTGERSGYLYYNGKLVTAERGDDFQVFRVGDTMYLVNEAGRVQNSNRYYRVDGEYRYEYDNGTIYYVNRNRDRIGEVTTGQRLPEIDYRAVYSL